jgi:hypothetical protein
MTVLSPQPRPLPKTLLLLSDIQFMDSHWWEDGTVWPVHFMRYVFWLCTVLAYVMIEINKYWCCILCICLISLATEHAYIHWLDIQHWNVWNPF